MFYSLTFIFFFSTLEILIVSFMLVCYKGKVKGSGLLGRIKSRQPERKKQVITRVWEKWGLVSRDVCDTHGMFEEPQCWISLA